MKINIKSGWRTLHYPAHHTFALVTCTSHFFLLTYIYINSAVTFHYTYYLSMWQINLWILEKQLPHNLKYLQFPSWILNKNSNKVLLAFSIQLLPKISYSQLKRSSLVTHDIRGGSVVLTSERRCKHALKLYRLMKQRSVTWTSRKVAAACQHLCVWLAVLNVDRADCLIKVLRPFKTEEAPAWWTTSPPQPTSLIFLLEAKWARPCLRYSVNCSSRAASRKWMTKWTYHLQQLPPGG